MKHDTSLFKNLPDYSSVAKMDEATLTEFRKNLREAVLATKLIGDMETVLTGDFNGSGDSGQYYISTDNDWIDAFLTKMLETHVTFDWYNNDGGGGDISWDVSTDKVTINGYAYITETESVMGEEEF